MTKPLLPVVLLSGFLGAGKTTFLRHLLSGATKRGSKAGVVINEWGAASVDGAILGASGAKILGELAGGCACCSSQDEMIWTMLELGQLPLSERPDFVALELSGLADPLVALDGLTVAALLPLIRVASLVAVIEAALVPELRTRSDRTSTLWQRQIALADLVVVNKTDGFLRGDKADEGRANLERVVRELNGRGAISFANHGEVALDSIWKRIEGGAALAQPSAGEAAHERTQTFVLPLPFPVSRAVLEQVFSDAPPGVWRSKGFVRVAGEDALFLVQYVGVGRKQFVLEEFEPRLLGSIPPTELVFIGPNLDETALTGALTEKKLAI